MKSFATFFAACSAASVLLLSVMPAQAQSTSLTVRAYATPAGGVWPIMAVRVNGTQIGQVTVSNTAPADFSFPTSAVRAGAKVDVVFTNDAWISGQDRNLFVSYLSDGAGSTVLPTLPGALIDKGNGAQAFDGVDTVPGQSAIWWSGALRLTWPAAGTLDAAALAQRNAAAAFLLQASFGPTPAEIDKVVSLGLPGWLTQQMALPYSDDFVNHVQAKFNLGAEYRPGKDKYTDTWVGEKFWATAVTAPDQLRKRVAFALHHLLMVSQNDSNLYEHSRAFARYYDILNQHAFGNYRALLEDIALSPAMGMYLSHIRNRKEDPASGRVPDENFAREVKQLMSIGLAELNADGSLKLDAAGKAIETYSNADVMGLAKVFTGWSWAFPDNELTQSKFRWGWPAYDLGKDTRIDILRMKAYPGQGSTSEVRLFAGKAWAVSIPANTAADAKLKIALDALFNHPNVGPFVGRQLIQQLVTSSPSPAYVARVAAAFANNGSGVRGDMRAVIRAVLLDAEARAAGQVAGSRPGSTPASTSPAGKLREPVLRVAQALRALGSTSSTGQYMMAWELDQLSQQVMRSPSVFGWFRPGYIPPGTSFAASRATAPEFQLVNESTTAAWPNRVEAMLGWGLGWTGSTSDVTVPLTSQTALAASGNAEALVQNLNQLLLAGRMSPALRQDILDAVGSVGGSDAGSHQNRARLAAFLMMSAPEFLAQR